MVNLCIVLMSQKRFISLHITIKITKNSKTFNNKMQLNNFCKIFIIINKPIKLKITFNKINKVVNKFKLKSRKFNKLENKNFSLKI